MRLRDISEEIRELLEIGPEALMAGDVTHALVQEVSQAQMIYRPVAPNARKDALFPWLAFSFSPFRGLIEPFNIYPGRFWALARMHKQPSGLPELITHIGRELPGASAAVTADLVVSFSNSPRVETVIKKLGKEPATLRFFHKGGLLDAQGNAIPAQYCLPGFQEAMPQGDVDDDIPGLVDAENGERHLYLGDLVFYNSFRTPDRARLRNFLLNCVSVAVVARYVRDIIRKNTSVGEAVR